MTFILNSQRPLTCFRLAPTGSAPKSASCCRISWMWLTAIKLKKQPQRNIFLIKLLFCRHRCEPFEFRCILSSCGVIVVTHCGQNEFPQWWYFVVTVFPPETHWHTAPQTPKDLVPQRGLQDSTSCCSVHTSDRTCANLCLKMRLSPLQRKKIERRVECITTAELPL